MVHDIAWKAYQLLINTIVPVFCSSCRLFLPNREIFCGTCTRLIKPITSKDLIVTPSYSLTVFAVSAYQQPLKDLILAKSYSDPSAAKRLAQLIITRTPLPHLPVDYCIPIPLHWTRYARRGYNQATIIAQLIAQKKEAHIADILVRSRRTPFQSSLPIEQRNENVSNAFSLTHKRDLLEPLRGKHLLLIDDLMTTGATLKEAAKLLLPLKPASLTAVVACRI